LILLLIDFDKMMKFAIMLALCCCLLSVKLVSGGMVSCDSISVGVPQAVTSDRVTMSARSSQTFCVDVLALFVGSSSWQLELSGASVSASITIYLDGKEISAQQVSDVSGVAQFPLFARDSMLRQNETSSAQRWSFAVVSESDLAMEFRYSVFLSDGQVSLAKNSGAWSERWQTVAWQGMLLYVDIVESSTLSVALRRDVVANVGASVGYCLNSCSGGPHGSLRLLVRKNETASEHDSLQYFEMPKDAGAARVYIFVQATDDDDGDDDEITRRDEIVSSGPFQPAPVTWTATIGVQAGDHDNKDDDSDDDDSLGTGAIVGIVIGVLLGVALLLGLIVFIVKRRRTSYESHSNYDQFD
jgi:Podoplanin